MHAFLQEHRSQWCLRRWNSHWRHLYHYQSCPSPLPTIRSGKSLSANGFLLHYQTSISHLSTHYLKAFNALPEISNPPRSLLVHIVIIPKGDKDLTLVTNYRPISLLNVDNKLYPNILANRITPLLPLIRLCLYLASRKEITRLKLSTCTAGWPLPIALAFSYPLMWRRH